MERQSRQGSVRRLAGFTCGLAAVFALGAAAGPARAVTFDLTIASSTYQVQAGDTYADLVAQHQSETQLSSDTLLAIQGVSSPIYAGVTTDYSILMTTLLNVTAGGTYQFQVGTDWGRGGAAVVIDNGTGAILDEFVTTNDLWWNNDWNDPDVFVTTVSLSAGSSYTLGWVGFEGCCGGATTVRFSYNGAPFQTMSDANLDPFATPEPGTAVLVALGLAGLSATRRRLR